MIKINEKLTILHDKNGSFIDLSDSLLDFTRREAEIEYNQLEDKVYIGFYKPINIIFAEMKTVNANSSIMDLKYYNGASFVAVNNFYDDTEGFSRSGFIRFDRDIEDQEQNEINGITQFWYELNLDVDSSLMEIRGLNIVFSDDQDLKRELYEIEKFLPSGVQSHILSHVAARDEIIQELRSNGRFKQSHYNEERKDITAFDLLDISQVKVASTYLVLSKILFSVSDNQDDFYASKSNHYRGLYNKCMKTFYLSLDTDDDGKTSIGENMASNSGGLVRR